MIRIKGLLRSLLPSIKSDKAHLYITDRVVFYGEMHL